MLLTPRLKAGVGVRKFQENIDRVYSIGRKSVARIPQRNSDRGKFKRREGGATTTVSPSLLDHDSSCLTLTASAPFGSTKKQLKAKKSTGRR